MFTPKQLDEITFGKAVFGGYDIASVDRVLEPLTEDYVTLYKENAALKSKMRVLLQKLESRKATDDSAAQKVLEEAQQNAARIIRDAETRAADIIAAAETTRSTAPALPAGQISELQQQMMQWIQTLEQMKTANDTAPAAAAPAAAPGKTGKASVDRPWMKFYPAGIEQMMAVPPVTLNEYMKMMCRGKDLPVIHYYGTEITWDEFFHMVDATARAMRAAGLGEGDQIPVLLRATPEFLIILLAAERIGASLLCRDNTIAENAEAIQKAGAKILFVHDFVTREAVQAYTAAGIERVILVNPWKMAKKDQMPEHIVNCLKSNYTEPKVTGNHVCKWEDFVAAGRIFIGGLEAHKDIDRPLYRCYTSGSTGTSKQVIHSARTMLGVIHQMSGYGNSDEFRPTWLMTILPPALVAVTVSMMLVPMCSNRLLILDPFVEPMDIDLEMMRYKPNTWPLIPMFMEILMKSPRIPADYDMSHMLACGAGAEASNNGQIRRAQKFLEDHNCHVIFSTSYGQSEACSNITFPAPGYEFGNGNVGMPMPLNVMGIFRGTNEVGYNKKGEICVTGPGIMLGYDNEDATSRTLIRHDDGLLWLHTGDTGYVNEDGVFFALGRGLAKRYDRENPQASERLVEIAMENQVCDADIPGLKDAFFVVAPDRKHEGYHVPYLYAVLEDGHTVDSIRDQVHGALETFQHPVEIIQIPERPFWHFKTNRLHMEAPYRRN